MNIAPILEDYTNKWLSDEFYILFKEHSLKLKRMDLLYSEEIKNQNHEKKVKKVKKIESLIDKEYKKIEDMKKIYK